MLWNKANQELIWLKLLINVDKLNRKVKEPGWSEESKQKVYRLKDKVIKKLLSDRPSSVSVNLYYVPYFRYSIGTKDRAGMLMRQDTERRPFEYYLSQVPPSADDIEVPEKASIEVVAVCMDQSFSFHMPVTVVEECGYSISALERKAWISQSNFNDMLLRAAKEEIASLLSQLT